MKLLNIQFTPITIYLVSFRSKHSFLRIVFSNFSANIPPSFSEVKSHTYKRTGNIVGLYILVFIFFELQMFRLNILDRVKAGIPGDQSALNFFMNAILIC